MDEVVATAQEAGLSDGEPAPVSNPRREGDPAVRPSGAFGPAVLDPRDGAVALGRPLGASGAPLAGTVAHRLARRGVGAAAATRRIGVDQGPTLVLER